METIYDNWDVFQQFLNLLEHHMGTRSEIVLHDLTKDYGNTIVAIRNGHISGRKEGDPGGDWGIEVMAGSIKNGDRYNVIFHTKDGKIIRSSTVFFRNEAGVPVGSMCLNMDITDSARCEEYLRSFNMCNLVDAISKPTTSLFTDVNELLTRMIRESIATVGKEPEDMTKEEKVHVISYLDKKGAFLITKSSEKVCESLGISKFTLYNYLDSSRTKTDEG